MKIGIVTSKFNRDITERLEKGAVERLLKKGVRNQDIIQILVPGAVEIPLACKLLLEKGCIGVVALGAVIRGDTSHFDYVCNSVERGITHLMLETGKPIAFGILTTENEDQAWARVDGAHGNKGADAAEVIVEMIELIRDLKKS